MHDVVVGIRPNADLLRRWSTGLVAYGLVGLLVAILGIAAFVWVGGRMTRVADAVEVDVRQLTTTLDRTAVTLRDASGSAGSFAGTLERTPPSVRQAAGTIRNLRPNLQALEVQLGSIEILGTAPLAVPARLFGDMARDLQDLDERLDAVAGDLESDRTALRTNATSLAAAADETARLADRLRDGSIGDALDGLRSVLLVAILVVVGSTALPAVGALSVGLWLRGRLRRADVRERYAVL
jgi:hypothetical protein